MVGYFYSAEFGYWLKNARTYKKMTMAQLSAQIGYSASGISKLERGASDYAPRKEMVIKFAEALNLDVDRALMLSGHIPRVADPKITGALSRTQLRIAALITDDMDFNQIEDVAHYIEFRKRDKNGRFMPK
ncbi:XRE family transcriptional regulator [Periweissella cryptocerci]|uniref:XRE family transcriptional regulator n=1 Tax=Periweissella cryptocerci TaxID=2506420 RepID=A0A4P6YRX6_9LACO|nr:helix-turn-helix transcriptional regulator [Periweissella cryptocerci]QBO35419.1 XRE family transcriptional regulator [Periweissella cryptocerci]